MKKQPYNNITSFIKFLSLSNCFEEHPNDDDTKNLNK